MKKGRERLLSFSRLFLPKWRYFLPSYFKGGEMVFHKDGIVTIVTRAPGLESRRASKSTPSPDITSFGDSINPLSGKRCASGDTFKGIILCGYGAIIFCLGFFFPSETQAATSEAIPAENVVTNIANPTFPGTVLSEDGQIIIPEGWEAERKNILLNEPKPADINPTTDSKNRAEAMALYSEGLKFESNGDFEAALAIYEKVVTYDPSFVDLRIKIGFEYLRREETEKATEIFRKIVEENPDSASAYTALSLTKKMAGNNEEAIKYSLKAIEINPAIVAPYQYLYEIYFEQGKFAETLTLLDKASEQLPDNSFFWVRLGDMYSNTLTNDSSLKTPENYQKLEAYYLKASELDPDNPEILRRIGDLYISQKQFTKARDVFNRYLALFPEAARVREKIAFCYAMEGDQKMAISILESILQRNPNRPEIHLFIGELKMDIMEYDAALTHFDKSVELNQAAYESNPLPNSPHLQPILTSYLQIALVNMQKRTPRNALHTLDKADVKFPENPRISYMRGLIYRDMKEYPQSIEEFKKTISRSKNQPDVINSNFYLDFGSSYEQAGDIEKAIEMLQKSISLDPENHLSLNYLGYMWADKGMKLNEAKKLINKALELDPDNAAYIDSLGWVYFRQENYKKALELIKKASENLKNKDDVVLDHLAQTYEKLGNYPEAIKAWEKALEISPHNERYQKSIEAAREKSKQPTRKSPVKK